jgi:hypothetical protein
MTTPSDARGLLGQALKEMGVRLMLVEGKRPWD